MSFNDKYSVIIHQNMHLPLKFADSDVHTVEFQVVPALNRAIILEMPFLYIFNLNIDWKTYNIT